MISDSQKSGCFLRKLIAEYLGGAYRHLLHVLDGLRCAKVEANEIEFDGVNFKWEYLIDLRRPQKKVY